MKETHTYLNRIHESLVDPMRQVCLSMHLPNKGSTQGNFIRRLQLQTWLAIANGPKLPFQPHWPSQMAMLCSAPDHSLKY